MRVLVTGAAGYIGSILCEHLLHDGHHVLALDKLIYEQGTLFHLCAHPHFDFVLGDVRDESLITRLIQEVDAIIPLAALVGAPLCAQNPHMAKSVNLEAIRFINEVRRPEQIIIFPTTNSGYGTQSGEVYCTEDTPLEPISLYGQTKVQAEQMLLESSNVVVLRFATIFGMSPRMRLDLLVNHFVYTAVTDGFIIIFEQDFKRNYLHVRDAADCFIHCLHNAASMSGKPYNVGLDKANLSKAELAAKVKEHVPDFYIHFASIGSDPDKRNYIVSNQRLREAGFEARRSLDDGIQELLKGYRMRGRQPFRNI